MSTVGSPPGNEFGHSVERAAVIVGRLAGIIVSREAVDVLVNRAIEHEDDVRSALRRGNLDEDFFALTAMLQIYQAALLAGSQPARFAPHRDDDETERGLAQLDVRGDAAIAQIEDASRRDPDFTPRVPSSEPPLSNRVISDIIGSYRDTPNATVADVDADAIQLSMKRKCWYVPWC